MRLLSLLTCLLFLALFACKEPLDLGVPTATTKPLSVTLTPANSPTIPRPVAPLYVDLYAQFTQPFPASATQRLQEIQVFIDSTVVARSIFTYNQAGLLESRQYIEYSRDAFPNRQTVSYTYDSQGRLALETYSRLNNPLDAKSEGVFKTLGYTYASDRLATVTQKTPHPAYGSFSSPTLSAYTSYRYTDQGIRDAVRLGYQCNVCGVNLPVSVDSTRQRVTTGNKLTTRLDSMWNVNRPYNGPVSASFNQVLVEDTSYDEKGNVLSARTITRYANSIFQPTTKEAGPFVHQYDGPGGLLSRSFYPAYALRYEFIYEPK